MTRRIVLFFGVLGLLAPLAAGQLFWVAESDAGRVYLLGSMHAGVKEFYPLPEVITKAFDESEALVVEADIREEQQKQYAMQIATLAAYPEGETLQDHVSAETLAKLEAQLKENGMQLAMFKNMKPWMLGMLMLAITFQKLGYDGDLGIDMHFLTLAAEEKKPIIELEGLMYQVNLFNNFNDELQEQFILDILDNQTEALQKLKLMSDAWIAGDAEKLEKFVLEERSDPKLEALYDVLIFKRNVTMANSIESYLNEGKQYFVVVGAGHLVGEGSVLDLLQQRGFKVRKL